MQLSAITVSQWCHWCCKTPQKVDSSDLSTSGREGLTKIVPKPVLGWDTTPWRVLKGAAFDSLSSFVIFLIVFLKATGEIKPSEMEGKQFGMSQRGRAGCQRCS